MMKSTKSKNSSKTKFLSLPNPKNAWLLFLTGVVIIQFAGLGLLYRRVHQIGMLTPSAAARAALEAQVYNAGAAGSLTHVVVSPTDNVVYIPELQIKLPLNATSLRLDYGIRTNDKTGGTIDPIEADITTPELASYTSGQIQRISCATAVRIKLEAKPDPYNPHEIVAASVKLADGRTLQVYAFHHDDCTAAQRYSNTDPDVIAAVFKSAASY